MKRLQKLREDRGLSRLEVSRRAKLAPTQYGWVETGRFIPYDRQLARVAEALEYEGDPEELLEDLED